MHVLPNTFFKLPSPYSSSTYVSGMSLRKIKQKEHQIIYEGRSKIMTTTSYLRKKQLERQFGAEPSSLDLLFLAHNEGTLAHSFRFLSLGNNIR